MIGITATDVTAYVAKRQRDTIVTRKARVVVGDDGTEDLTPEERKPVSPAEINRELQILKRIFNLAMCVAEKGGYSSTGSRENSAREPSGTVELDDLTSPDHAHRSCPPSDLKRRSNPAGLT